MENAKFFRDPGALFICEKPSLAVEVAKTLGVMLNEKPINNKPNGYHQVGKNKITWGFGHMLSAVNPDEYPDGRWAGSWRQKSLILLEDGESLQMTVSDEGKVRQLKIIDGLLNDYAVVCSVGDPGREGQLLIDEILAGSGRHPHSVLTEKQILGWKRGSKEHHVLRLWAQALDEKSLLSALQGVFPNSEKSSLFEAAVVRQQSDWMHGMTMTRIYTELGRQSQLTNSKVSVGRVKSPTLKLVVDRDRERENFKAVDHYLPTPTFKHSNGEFKASWVIPEDQVGVNANGQLTDKAVASKIAAEVSGKPGVISAWKSERKQTACPRPHSLTSLQAAAGKKLGLGAQEVIDAVQSLYESKMASYPRTDSNELPLSMMADVPGMMRALGRMDSYSGVMPHVDLSRRSACWVETMSSDHHAIVPTADVTQSRIDSLSQNARDVFGLIASVFIAQFMGPMTYEACSVEVTCQNEKFKTTGRTILDPGWKRIYQDPDEEDAKATTLPKMTHKDPVQCIKSDIASKRTSPPPAFTEGALVEAMKNIHKYVTDANVKARLKESSGIGTSATRASIIGELVDIGYFVRKGKGVLESTPFGRAVTDMLDPDISSPVLTAGWEEAMDEIYKGKREAGNFMKLVKQNIKRLHDEARSKLSTVDGDGKPCNVCRQGHMSFRSGISKTGNPYRALFCDNGECGNKEWLDNVQPSNAPKCPQCQVGSIIERSGVSKASGKPYRGNFCSKSCGYKEFLNVEDVTLKKKRKKM